MTVSRDHHPSLPPGDPRERNPEKLAARKKKKRERSGKVVEVNPGDILIIQVAKEA